MSVMVADEGAFGWVGVVGGDGLVEEVGAGFQQLRVGLVRAMTQPNGPSSACLVR